MQTAVSQAVARFHAEKLEVPEGTFPVIYNGILPPEKLTDAQVHALREEWGVETCQRVLGSVGRLDWQKGYDQLLGCLPALEAQIPDGETWGVVLIGDGPVADELQQQADTLNLKGKVRVVFPGFRPDADQAMGAFDCFVMPSRYEGFGLTLAEAMAHGLPVVCSNVDSLPELMAHYPNGEAIDWSGDEGTVCSALLTWMTAEKRIGTSPFIVDSMVADYLRLYQSLL